MSHYLQFPLRGADRCANFTYNKLLSFITACENQGSNNSGTQDIVHSGTSEGMILEWNDEFDGDSLDRTKWEAPNNMPRQGASHWMNDQVSVMDGNLILGITKTTDALIITVTKNVFFLWIFNL